MPRSPYPRLRQSTPIVDRSANRVQVGVGPGSVVLDHVDDAGRRFLALLTGEHPLPVLAERAGLRAAAATSLVRSLDVVGLLVPATPALGQRTIKVVGCGVLGAALVTELGACGVRRLLLADHRPADPGLYPGARPGATNADALAETLPWLAPTSPGSDLARQPGVDPAPTAIQVVAHWTKPDGVRPDLTVVTTDAPECDRGVTDTLVREDLTHLLLRGQDDGVVVGPFVEPGTGSCLRCSDLHRRDRDPDWPMVLHQLSRVPGRPPPPVVGWGASTAAVQVLAWAAGSRPETWGATLELSAHDWLTRLRTWPLHPHCGCAGFVPA